MCGRASGLGTRTKAQMHCGDRGGTWKYSGERGISDSGVGSPVSTFFPRILGAERDLSQAGNTCPKWTLLAPWPQEIWASCATTNGLRCPSDSWTLLWKTPNQPHCEQLLSSNLPPSCQLWCPVINLLCLIAKLVWFICRTFLPVNFVETRPSFIWSQILAFSNCLRCNFLHYAQDGISFRFSWDIVDCFG